MSDPDERTSRGPTRATVAGRAYLDLQHLARAQHRPTDELHQLYALEGLLARLVASPHAEKFVLKGGVLLAAYDVRRPTRDIDMQARAIDGEPEQVLAIVREIAAIELEDGLVFDTDAATIETIRDEDEYSGVRVSLTATLSTSKLALHVDINIGDPIWPAPRSIELPRLLGGSVGLTGYPLTMVYAEKIITAAQRGTVNTRWRDFADLYMLRSRHAVDADELQHALAEVAAYRAAEIVPLVAVLDGYAALAQQRWSAWRRKQLLEDRLPAAFADILNGVIAFADPVLTGAATGRNWDPAQQAWA